MNTSLSPDERAELLLSVMTLDQKLTVISEPTPGLAIPELGIPGRREIDVSTGIVSTPGANGPTPTTAFPSGLALASTWDRERARDVGRQIGEEGWNLGWTGLGGPTFDLRRNPFHGRQQAGFGEDPLLAGLMPTSVVQGIQEKNVYSLTKHYLGNTQETQRRTLNNVLDERSLREIHVRQWEPVIKEGEPGAVMCAFPQVNGQFACQNPNLLWDILKGELGYKGAVSSDFGACYTIEAYALGADRCSPTAFSTKEGYLAGLENGTLTMERLDDMVRRYLRTFFAVGIMDDPPPGSLVNAPGASAKPAPAPLPADVVQRGRDLSYRTAVDGSVLLRNRANALPLNTNGLESIAVIGEGADRYMTGFGSDIVTTPTRVTTVVDGIRERAGAGVEVTHVDGSDPVRVGDLMPGAQAVPSGVLRPASGEGAGLTAQWYTNPAFAGAPVVTRTEDQINWGQSLVALFALFGYDPSPSPKLPPQFIGVPTPSVRWTGTLNPTVSGTYELGLTHLGRATLWLDGRELVNDPGTRLRTASVPVQLEAGRSYEVRIDHVADAPNQGPPAAQNIGPAIRFSWTPPNGQASPQIRQAVEAARNADVAVVVAHDYMGESLDRGHLNLFQNQDLLIRAVANANPNTVVVLATGAPVVMPWLNQVAAVFQSWYPGQEQGRAIAALLFGDENFSGKLPVTWPRSEQQVTEGLGVNNPYYDINNPGVTVTQPEGVNVGYRGFDQNRLDPLFEFGYGLSYSRFDYRNMQIRDPRAREWQGPLNDLPGNVRVRVRNTSDRAGTEIVQIYHGRLPAQVQTPPKQLLGWARVTLQPGEARWVDVPVQLYTPTHLLAYWNADVDSWITPTGRVQILAGASSRQIRITGNMTVREPQRRPQGAAAG